MGTRLLPTGSGKTIYLTEGVIMGWVIGIGCLLAWFTHVFTCFATGAWGFLIAGAIFFPVGILHGMYLWFH